MLRQALRGPSRTIGTAVRAAAQPAVTPLSFRPLSAARLPATARPVAAAPRWYSTEPDTASKKTEEAAAKSDGGAAKAEDGSGLTPAEAELAKKLEAKEREAIDWKVRLSCPVISYSATAMV